MGGAHLLVAIDNGFQQKAGRVPLVAPDQTSVRQHRCEVVTENALEQRHQVALLGRFPEYGFRLQLTAGAQCGFHHCSIQRSSFTQAITAGYASFPRDG